MAAAALPAAGVPGAGVPVRMDDHGRKHLVYWGKYHNSPGSAGKKTGADYDTAQFNIEAGNQYRDILASVVDTVRKRVIDDPTCVGNRQTWFVQFENSVGWSNGSKSRTVSLKGSDALGWHIHPIDDHLVVASKDKKGRK